jgi:hypothetical protein
MNLNVQLLKQACLLSNIEYRIMAIVKDVLTNFHYLKKTKVRVRNIK